MPMDWCRIRSLRWNRMWSRHFSGRIADPRCETFLDDSSLPIIKESAYRIIMYVSLKDVTLLRSIIDGDAALKIINGIRDSIQGLLKEYKGSEVIKDNSKLIVSFVSAASAVLCAHEIQDTVKAYFDNGHYTNHNIKISLCAGLPVTSQNGLFGEAVQLAERLCEVSNHNQIVVSSAVKELYNNEKLDGLLNEKQFQTLSPDDEGFVNQLTEITNAIWNDPKFEVGFFGKQIGLSRSRFYRKISAITGLSPNNFIMAFKLKRALKLIEAKKGNITQIAFETGFNSPSYFSKCFQKRYGLLPSQLVSKLA